MQSVCSPAPLTGSPGGCCVVCTSLLEGASPWLLLGAKGVMWKTLGPPVQHGSQAMTPGQCWVWASGGAQQDMPPVVTSAATQSPRTGAANTLDHTQPGVGHKECQSDICLLLHALHVSQYLVTSPAACLLHMLPPLLPRRPCRSCCRRL
jgi:hypothetical protein